MRGFLIRLLGGVTAKDYADVFTLAHNDRSHFESLNLQLASIYENERTRANHLEELILLKVGYIPSEVVPNREAVQQTPIGGSKNPRIQLQMLQKRDHEEFVKRNKEMRSRDRTV